MPETRATVYIHGGAYDCSELVRMAYRASDVLPYGCHMWTGNERELLSEHGFRQVGLNDLKRGDVLWKSGHTEMYLGNGLQGGARIDESGGVTGSVPGDQTGREITKSAYDQGYWKWQSAWRYFGDKTVNGIPASEVAAQVVEHVIDHDAEHGYSQPYRAGNGTIEPVKIVWNDNPHGIVPLEQPIDFTFNQKVRVRTAPTTKGGTFQGVWWQKGETATFDGIAFGDGFVWGTYIGPTTGRRLFAAMGSHEYGTI